MNLNVADRDHEHRSCEPREIPGFESDRMPLGADEIYAAKTEVMLEGKIVDASGIVASLSAGQGSPIEVKSVSQQVGSIRSGRTLSPL